MTEEGELKKRIMEAGKWVNGGVMEGTVIYGSWWATNQREALEAIDEAKKDLLESDTTDTMDIEVGAWYSVKVYVKKNTLNCDEPNFICIDYKKWKKWFGGCEESSGEAK